MAIASEPPVEFRHADGKSLLDYTARSGDFLGEARGGHGTTSFERAALQRISSAAVSSRPEQVECEP
jgi:hypothetical protein